MRSLHALLTAFRRLPLPPPSSLRPPHDDRCCVDRCTVAAAAAAPAWLVLVAVLVLVLA